MESNSPSPNRTLSPRVPSESSVSLTEIVLPGHANALGTIFGGRIMSQIDVCAAIAATKHARKAVVTASIDALHFVNPVKVGHFVHYRASVNYTGKTSMEVGVRVDSENPITGELTHTASAYTTFVALDDNGRPCAVPPLQPESPDEVRRHAAALARRASRIALAETIKSSKASGRKSS